MSEPEKNILETEIKASKKVSNIRKDIKGLTLVEVSELIAGVKEDFQIKEEALIQATATPAEEKKEEKTGNVSVKWVGMEEEKTSIIPILGDIVNEIKELNKKELTKFEAKRLAEEGEKIILTDIPRDKAEKFQEEMKKKNAKVEIVETK